jgi:hypothetical protein
MREWVGQPDQLLLRALKKYGELGRGEKFCFVYRDAIPLPFFECHICNEQLKLKGS